MKQFASVVARAGLAVTLFLLALALLRLGPVYGEPPLPVRALPLALLCLGFAVATALAGRPRRPRPWRAAAAGLVLAGAALGAVVALRGPAGLSATVLRPVAPGPPGPGPGAAAGSAPAAEAPAPREFGEAAREAGTRVASLRPGAIDLMGADLEGLKVPRRVGVRWSGPLRVPTSGTYRLWALGRGRVVVRLDGRRVLDGDGERLEAAAHVPIGRGEHLLEVDYTRVGPGPRLRLGWDRPAAGPFRLARSEVLPPRALGAARHPGWWIATDALAIAVAGLLALLFLWLPWEAPRVLPFPGDVTRAEIAASLGGQLAVVSVMTWPLVADLAGQGVFNRPDGRLNAWILAWDAHALLHEPSRLFQAPIFHPLPDALAFSENLLLPALLALPAQLVGGPALAYNLVLLVSNAISGLGVHLLIRRATGDRLAAFAGGAFFAAGIHRSVNMAHLHAQATLFLPFALLALDRFLERPLLPRALLVGLLLALQGMSSVYLGAITAVCLGVAAALAAVAGRLPGKAAVRLAAGFLVAAILLWPLASPYLRMRAFQGEEFTLATVANYATTPESYAAGAGRFYEDLSRRHLDPERVRDPLFPGLLPILLGVAGLAVAPRRYAWAALATSCVAVTLSLGPATGFYRFLHEHVVLFHGLRALARFSIVPVLALSVLLGLALAGRGRLRLLALVLLLAEAHVAPIGYGRYEPPPAAARWLAGQAGAVLAWPLGEDDTARMLEATAHFRPLVNGDSGFLPRPYARAMEQVNDRFGEEALRLLRALGVTHVVARGERPLPGSPLPLPEIPEPPSLPLPRGGGDPARRELPRLEAGSSLLRLRPVARFPEASVYAVPDGELARVPEAAPAWPALWSPRGVVLDMGEEREVARVTFEIGEGDWSYRPRVELSSDSVSWRDVPAEASLADATLALYRDPRHGRGELRFAPERARFLRLDRRLPARPGTLGAAP